MCSRRCSTLCFNDPGGWFSRAPIDRKLNRIAGHAALSRRFFIEPVVISAVHIYMKLQEKISFLLSLDKVKSDNIGLFPFIDKEGCVMSRIKEFRFSWCDAWRRIDEGYDSILETSDKGDVVIRFLVNSKPYKIVLTEKESEFIDDLAFLKTWNQKEYINECYLDGTNWKLFFTYDDTAVCSRGSNGFPVTFTDFLDLLHEKYNIPKSLIEKGYEKKMKDVIKETTIVKNPKLDNSAMYF